MGQMKTVKLNEEESREFVKLLEQDASPEEMEAFLNGKTPETVAAELLPVLELTSQLDQLMEEEHRVAHQIYGIRRKIQEELTLRLLGEDPKNNSGKIVLSDGPADPEDPQKREENVGQNGEQTSPTKEE